MAVWFLRIFALAAVSFCLSYMPIRVSDDFFSVMYTVIGIMFPLALSQTMAFSFSEVENDKFVEKRRGQLSKIRIIFIVLFSLSTGVFIFKTACIRINWKWIRYDIKFLFFSFLLFCLLFYIVNFISLIKLKDEVDGEIRNYNKKQKEKQLNAT